MRYMAVNLMIHVQMLNMKMMYTPNLPPFKRYTPLNEFLEYIELFVIKGKSNLYILRICT